VKFEIIINLQNTIDVSQFQVLIVGRNPDLCNIVIPDKSVSAIHCLISVGVPLLGTSDRIFWITDGDGQSPSTNGCFLNGVQLIKQGTRKNNCPAFNNDFINIGETTIKFCISSEQKLDPKATIPNF